MYRYHVVCILIWMPLIYGCNNSRSLSSCLTQVHSSDERTRIMGIQCLAQLGPRAVAALPDLMDATQDKSVSIRCESVLALGAMGPSASEAVPLLIEMLDTTDCPHVVVAALGGIGKPAVEDLVECLAQGDRRQGFAAQALSKIGREAAKAILPLIDVVLRGSEESRLLAAAAIAEIGTSGELEIQRIVAVQREKDAGIRRAGIVAVLGMEDSALSTAVATLKAAAKDRESIVRAQVMVTAGKLAGAVQEVKPLAVEALNDPVAAVRCAGAEALLQLRVGIEVIDAIRSAEMREDDEAARACMREVLDALEGREN